MLLNKKGENAIIDGKSFTVGMPVKAINSEYEGLYGTILEIRDGEDKETENETIDIYCEFFEPEHPVLRKDLEERFSELYGQQKSIDNIILDCVIMSPDMIRESKGIYYDVAITETLQTMINLYAESPEEAEEIIEAQWNESEIIIDAENFISVEFDTAEAEHTADMEESYEDEEDLEV